MLAGVGIYLGTRAVVLVPPGNVLLEAEALQWPSPFERPIRAVGPNDVLTIEEGDQALWYAASGAVAFLTLASLPMLWARERRRAGEG